MMRQIRNAVLVTAGVAALVSAEQKKFNMYGFMDATLQKFTMEENNPVLAEGFDDAFRFRVGNINLYNDFRPNENIRVLVETSFHWQPHGEYYPGYIGVQNPGGIAPEGTQIPLNDGPENSENEISLQNSGGTTVPLYSIELPRAWFEYNINQYANVRIGKFITPAGIWNVDHGSPIILTASQPYQTGLTPIFPKDQVGFMEYGTAFLGDFDLDYKLFLSTGRSIQTITELKDISVGGNIKFKAPWGSGFEFGFSGYTGLEKMEDHYALLGGDIKFDAQFNPIGFAPDFHTFSDSIVPTVQTRENAIGIDSKFGIKGLLLQGELNYNYLENQLTDEETNILGWYGLLGYKFRIHPKFNVTPYFMYENISRVSGVSNREIIPLFGNYMDELGVSAVGLNFNIFTNSNIKVEYRHLNFTDENFSDDDKINDKYNEDNDFGSFAIQFAVAF